MSVRPVAFNADGSIDVVYDEQGHSGTILPANIQWGVDHRAILLACPDDCGAVSNHPVGGGAAPVTVQEMFVHKTERDGCACGNVPASTTALPESHVRLNCNRMDGPGRWQADIPQLRAYTPEPQENAPDMFQVVYHETTRRIDGLEPAGGVGPDHKVAVIHDMAEYDNLLRYDPAYLAQDGDHIVGAPPA